MTRGFRESRESFQRRGCSYKLRHDVVCHLNGGEMMDVSHGNLVRNEQTPNVFWGDVYDIPCIYAYISYTTDMRLIS